MKAGGLFQRTVSTNANIKEKCIFLIPWNDMISIEKIFIRWNPSKDSCSNGPLLYNNRSIENQSEAGICIPDILHNCAQFCY